MLIISGATNVNLKGIKFQHTSQGGKDGYRFGSESNIRILNCMDMIIEQCEFSNIGSIGLYLKNSSRILVQDNAFFDIGSGFCFRFFKFIKKLRHFHLIISKKRQIYIISAKFVIRNVLWQH